MNLNKKPLLIIAVILVGVATLYLVFNMVNQTQERVVTNMIKDLKENKKVEGISEEDQKKLRYFFEYPRKKDLESPNTIISDYPDRPEIVKVTFEIIENNEQTGIEAIYEGTANIYLTKQGRDWEVEEVEVSPYRKER
ncbi:hypothetical protein N5C46_16485 [Rossellomorea vietnamensis]|uniref:Uncharacterized protein n=1 Tax=Rossellomorea vietnamensis TaxID=218284 RepID=A0ACD4C4C7_9BACI|nr:hypothetical protein [Rossellomorea vietnamensis]UXH43277.1 hypothetical protein N5C46_16485 [Rossellomorea vietnamensis]